MGTDTRRWQELARLFALGGATLMLEVLLTRIAAVTLFANLAFGVIALSLFGLAAGGAWAERSVFTADYDRERAIRNALIAAAVFTLLSALLATKLPFVPDELSWNGRVATTFSQRRNAFDLDPGQVHWAYVALLVLCQAVPFAMAGYAQAQSFARGRTPVSFLYAADLAGAAVGSVGTLGLLRKLGATDATGIVAILFVASAVSATSGLKRKERVFALATTAVALVVLIARPFGISHAAGFSEGRTVAVDWSALARIGLYERGEAGTGLDEPTLVVDNTSATEVAFAHDARFSGNLERIPYSLRPTGDVLVIGAGGGQEIETALATAPDRRRHVDAIELADGEERLMRRFFGGRSDFLLDQPGVTYRIADGRSFLEMTPRRWDVIQMKEVNFHSFAGQAASAWSPSLLFTAEAMRSELEHLTPTGLLAMNKGMYYGGEAAMTLEMVSTLRSATDALGWELGPRLVIVDRRRESGFQRMCLASVAPFTDEELVRIGALAKSAGLTVRRTPRLVFPQLEEVVVGDRRRAVAGVRARGGIVIDPTTDDRPFGRQSDHRFLLGGIVLIAALSCALVGRSMRRTRHAQRRLALRQLAICALLGIAFMLLEVILVERVSLLLGHPTVGFVAVVTSMLCGLGLGSGLSGALVPERAIRRAVVVAACALAVVYGLTAATASWGPWFRVLDPSWRPWVAAVPMLVGAIPLGMVLPSTLRLASVGEAASTAACWSTNAAGSVLGTVGAALLVRTAGFSVTSHLAWLAYGGALALWLDLVRRAPRDPQRA